MSATLKKKAKGYNYKYTDLAGIHTYLEHAGLSYYQYIDVLPNGSEQVYTIRSDMEQPIAGCIVPKATLKDGKQNPAQAYGAALTYARRYSLLMAYGLATSDDDAECLTIPEGALGKDEPIGMLGMRETILAYCNEHRLNLKEVAEQYGITKDMTEEVLAGKLSMLKRDYGE